MISLGEMKGKMSNLLLIVNTESCVYHGKIYRQGQKWKDGCLVECECFDEATGRYRCTEV